ncbi:MAG: hypothetical protein AB8B50_14000 [Pirellulaceae bacterium]
MDATDLFRSLLAASLLSLCLGSSSQAAEPDDSAATSSSGEPVTVFVASENTSLRSGPSLERYATRILAKGTQLEVYLRTADGWLGVRPPSGSFSWIQAKNAYLLPGGKVIEITEPDTVSWIGTRSKDVSNYGWQVRLERGEQLAVLGEATRKATADTKTLWYRIRPPSGEFRWIHEDQVATELTQELLASSQESEEVSGSSAGTPVDEVVAIPATGSKPVKVASAQATQVANGSPMGAVANGGSADERAVQTAQYQEAVADDVFGSAPPQSILLSDQPIAGGEIVYESPVSAPASKGGSGFGGWHALEFADDGLHFKIFENALGKRGPVTDPMEWDPYNLSMPKPVGGQRSRVPAGVTPRRTGQSSLPSSGYQSPQPMRGGSSMTSERPWRDPSTLRANREQGYLGSASRSGQSNRSGEVRQLVDGIRSNVERLRNPEPVGNRLGGSIGGLVDQVSDRFQSRDSMQLARDEVNGADEAARLGFRSGVGSEYPGQGSISPSSSAGRAADSSSADRAAEVDWYGVKPGSQSPAQGDSAATSRELNGLRVRLASMVSQPPNTWQLDQIVQQAQYIVENGRTPLERGQARLLLERIAEFQGHAQRTAFVPGMNLSGNDSNQVTPFKYSSRAGAPVTTASFQSPPLRTSQLQVPGSGNSASLGTNPVQRASYAEASPATSSVFDATGILVPVYAAQRGQPSHALADDSGAIVAYVTGLPGMNLDIYRNQAVGILGLKGYLPSFQAGHIQAESISRLR